MQIKKIDIPNELFEIKKNETEHKVNEFGLKKFDIVWIDYNRLKKDKKHYSNADKKFENQEGFLGIYKRTNEIEHVVDYISESGQLNVCYISKNSNALFKTEKQYFQDNCLNDNELFVTNFKEFISKNINLMYCISCGSKNTIKIVNLTANQFICRCNNCSSTGRIDRLVNSILSSMERNV